MSEILETEGEEAYLGLSDALHHGGYAGMELYGYAELVRFQPPIASDRYPDLHPTVERARANAERWVSGGQSKLLYDSLTQVKMYHGALKSVADPFLDSPGRLESPADRAKLGHRLERLSLRLDGLATSAKQRGVTLAEVQKRVSGDNSQLGGILANIEQDAKDVEIGRLTSKIELLDKGMADNRIRRQELIQSTVRDAEMVEQLGDQVFADDSFVRKLFQGAGKLAVAFDFIFNKAHPNFWIDDWKNAFQILDDAYAKDRKEKERLLAELWKREVDAAKSAVLSGPVRTISDQLDRASLALSHELSGWQNLTALFDEARERIATAKEADPNTATSLKRFLRRARLQADDLRERAAKTMNAQMIPTE